MATITETITGTYRTLTLTKRESKLPPAPSLKSEVCPPDCPCRKEIRNNKYSMTGKILFNGLGIIVALLATYLLVTTDSKLYLFFWIFYSVLRRLITKSKSKLSAPKTNLKSD